MNNNAANAYGIRGGTVFDAITIGDIVAVNGKPAKGIWSSTVYHAASEGSRKSNSMDAVSGTAIPQLVATWMPGPVVTVPVGTRP